MDDVVCECPLVPLSGFIRHKLSVYTYKVHTTEVYKGPPAQSDDDKNQVQVRFFSSFCSLLYSMYYYKEISFDVPFSYAYWVINDDDWQPWTVSQDIWCQKNDFSPYSQPLPLIWFFTSIDGNKKSGKKGEGKDMTIKQKKILLKSIQYLRNLYLKQKWNFYQIFQTNHNSLKFQWK